MYPHFHFMWNIEMATISCWIGRRIIYEPWNSVGHRNIMNPLFMFNLRTILFYELSPPIYSVGVDPSVYVIRLLWSVYTLSFCPTACLWTPLVIPLWPGVQSWLHCTAFCAPAVSYWRMRSVFYFWVITDPSYHMRYLCDLDGLC